MHVRTQLRIAVRDRLIAANVAGGNVFTRDPRLIGETSYPLVVIEPETENNELKSHNNRFSRRAADGKMTGRAMVRKERFSITSYALDQGPKDADGNLTDVSEDADQAADDVAAAIEAALFDADNRLTVDGQRLGEIDLRLLGAGGVSSPATGVRQPGALHQLFEATLMTDEGDPSVVSNRQ